MPPTVRILLLALLAAPLLLAGEPARSPFPDDYRPQPCAAETACSSYPRSEFSRFAGLHGFTIDATWADSHWDEILAALEPWCAKASACYANPVNTWTWCNDVAGADVAALCARYPEGSPDRDQCFPMARTLWAGFDRTTRERAKQIRDCALDAAAPGERTMVVWTVPAVFDASYDGTFTVFALDGETRIPVQATLSIEGQRPTAINKPGGKLTAALPVTWKLSWNRVPNADGHHDLAVPTLHVAAPGYRTVSIPVPAPLPRLTVEMTPRSLKTGKNRLTIAARDSVTNVPVEMRVLAGTSTVGRTNEPFELDLPPGSKRPEIWITSLFGAYGDVVVVREPRE